MEPLTYTGIDRDVLNTVDVASIATVDAVAANHRTASVIIIEGPASSVAAAVALHGAEAAAGDHANTDVRVAVPDGDRWGVDELATKIVDPSAMSPDVRNHIVVVDADKMATIAADRLLKVTEEPAAPTTFWFAVTDTSRLLTTLRGRSTATVVANLVAPSERAALLATANGIGRETATRIVELCADEVTVASAAAAVAAGDPDTFTAFGDLFATAMPTADPVTAARSTTELIDTVAGALGANAADRKVFVRQLTRMQIDRWVAAERARLGANDLAAATFSEITRRLAALDDAVFSLGVSITPADVLAATFTAAVPHTKDAR